MDQRARTGFLAAVALGAAAIVAAQEPTPPVPPAPGQLPGGAVQRLGGAELRFGQSPSKVEIAADGKRAAAWFHNQAVLWLDLEAGTVLYTKKEHPPFAERGLVLAPNGKTLVSITGKKEVELWDVEKRKQLHLLSPGHVPRSAAFSLDGRRLAVGEATPKGEGNIVSLWDVETGKREREIRVLPDLSVTAAFSADGDMMATWGYQYPPPAGQKAEAQQTIQLWQVKTGNELRKFVSENGRIEAAALSPDDKLLAALTGKGSVEVWDAGTSKRLRQFPHRLFVFASLRFSPDGQYLLGLDSTGKAQVWETKTWTVKRAAGDAGWRISSFAFPDRQVLACGAAGQTLRVQDLFGDEKRPPASSHKYVVQELRFLSTRTLLSADVGGQVLAWELATGKPLGTWDLLADLPKPTDPTRQFPKMALAAEGKYLAAFDGAAERIRVWDLPARKAIAALSGPKHGGDTALAFAPGGKLAYLVMDRAKKEETVVLYDLAAEKEVSRFKLPPPADAKLNRFGFPELAFSADGRLLAAAIQHNVAGKVGTEVFLWDVRTGYKKHHLLQQTSYTPFLDFAPDGTLLALGGPREGITLVETWTGERRALEGIDRSLDAVAFSPDGRTVAGATYHNQDKTAAIYVWERASKTIRCAYQGHQGKLHALAFSPDGKTLASAGQDGLILRWDVTGVTQFAAKDPPAPAAYDALWAKLADAQGKKALPALATMAAHPHATLAFLKKHLHPEKGKEVTAEEIQKLIADLDDDEFDVREKATQALQKLGPRALRELNKAMRETIPVEQRLRIEGVLKKIGEPVLDADRLRLTRAIEVLERIGDQAARDLLSDLAQGTSGELLTEDARAAMARLKGAR